MADLSDDLCSLRIHRALFLSDLHLGSLGCRADLVLDFLSRNSAPVIYLVGDILDIWHPLRVHWTATHDAIIDHLCRQAEAGVRLVYLVGNHDAEIRRDAGHTNLPVEIAEDAVHETAHGQRYLVLHGDICDSRLMRWHICTRIGSRVDSVLRMMDHSLRNLRHRMHPEKRSFIQALLSWVNSALSFGHGHEKRLVTLAKARGHDGVICGHFHLAGLHHNHGLLYANCGDWVDSFTAIAEDHMGRLSVVGGRKAVPSTMHAPLARPIATAPIQTEGRC
jgi:UDP-2,3-diacylglucosamine pyrophosphatase LpxH